MSPEQVHQQLMQELLMNERVAELLKIHAKNYADDIYRRTARTTDPNSLVRLTGVAAGVEDFIDSLLTTEKGKQ